MPIRAFLATVFAAFVCRAAALHAQVVEVPAFTVGQPTFATHLQDIDVTALPDGGFAVVWGDYTLGNASGSGGWSPSPKTSALLGRARRWCGSTRRRRRS